MQRHDLSLAHRAVFRTEAVGGGAIGEESALQVRVSEKSQRHGQRDQRRERVSQRDDIFVFVVGRAVNQLNVGKVRHGNRALRQGAQPLEIFGRQFVARPDARRRRPWD